MNEKILIVLRRIGPYHHARFNHVGKNLDLHVLETRPFSQEYPWQFDAKGTYKRYSLGAASDPEKGFRGRLLMQKVKSLLNDIQPTVVVTVGWADPECHSVLLWAQHAGRPSVIVSDSTQGDGRRFLMLEYLKRLIIRNYSGALVAGERSHGYLMGLGMDQDRIYKGWDVVDNAYFKTRSAYFRKASSNEDGNTLPDNYFLCVARFIAKKNHGVLLDAYGKYVGVKKAQAAALVLLGSGELEKTIKHRATAMGLADRVHFRGFTQLAQLPFFYAYATALVLPSVTDQWGLVVNEAMACGCPAIVSDGCGCADDLVEHGRNGFIVQANNANALAETLVKFPEKDSLQWNKMSRVSMEIISQWDLDLFTVGLTAAVRHSYNRVKKTKSNLLGRTIGYGLVFLT